MKLLMINLKKISYIILCLFALTGSIAITGCGHSHSHSGSHSHTPHDGILTSLFDSKGSVGFVELKLHDDKGDLELWLTNSVKSTPFDIPLDSNIKVTFTDMGDKEILLKARNKIDNEDEEGKSNIRNGKTNYFIFPGDTGESARFLQGSGFSSTVVVSFVVESGSLKTGSFVLRPHKH